MRIGIDIDDTICNSWENIIRVVCDDFNLDYDEVLNSKKVYNEIITLKNDEYLDYAKKFRFLLKNPSLKDNVKEVLDELSLDNEIIFLTARSDYCYGDAYQFCKEFLDKNDIYYDKIIVNALDKGKVCDEEEIDIFIDDSRDNCCGVSKIGIRVIMFENYFNAECNLYEKVSDWGEILNVVKEEKNAREVV